MNTMKMNAILFVFFSLLYFSLQFNNSNWFGFPKPFLEILTNLHIISTINSPVNTAIVRELYNNRGRSSMGRTVEVVEADSRHTELIELQLVMGSCWSVVVEMLASDCCHIFCGRRFSVGPKESVLLQLFHSLRESLCY